MAKRRFQFGGAPETSEPQTLNNFFFISRSGGSVALSALSNLARKRGRESRRKEKTCLSFFLCLSIPLLSRSLFLSFSLYQRCDASMYAPYPLHCCGCGLWRSPHVRFRRSNDNVNVHVSRTQHDSFFNNAGEWHRCSLRVSRGKLKTPPG
jgi:hypothetical protein